MVVDRPAPGKLTLLGLPQVASISSQTSRRLKDLLLKQISVLIERIFNSHHTHGGDISVTGRDKGKELEVVSNCNSHSKRL